MVHQARIKHRTLQVFNFGKAELGERISRTRTCRPCSTRADTRCCPMKPLPPVTSILVMYAGATGLTVGESMSCDVLAEEPDR